MEAWWSFIEFRAASFMRAVREILASPNHDRAPISKTLEYARCKAKGGRAMASAGHVNRSGSESSGLAERAG